MKRTAALLVYLLGCGGEALAQSLFANPHELLVEALQNGSATGVMRGPIADHFTDRLQSKSPLLVQARILRRYQQPGCARLEMVFTKDQVATPKGLTQAVMRSQVNYCLDGKPPEHAL